MSNGFNKRILLVEDASTVQMIAHYFLKDLGCSVEIVAHGLLALEALKHNSYNILFLDINLPDISGLEVCKRVRNELQLLQLPIIGVSEHAYRDDCLKVGMNDFVRKPVKKERFKKLLDKWVR